MANEPRWLTPDEIVALNRAVVDQTNEPFTLRDRGLLESACSRPSNHWRYEEDNGIVSLAAILLLGLARNHPFAQGNKRTAFAAAVLFLEANGWTLGEDADSQLFADRIIAVIIGVLPDEILTPLFEAFVRPL